MLTYRILLKVLLLLCSHNFAHATKQLYTRYKIAFELPFSKEEYNPSISCFYQGQQFLSNGCIEIIVPSMKKDFYLLIVDSIRTPKNPNIDALTIHKGSDYRLWHISSSYEYENTHNTYHLVWSAVEKNINDTLKIPDDTIIMLWKSPSDILEIKDSKSSTTGPLISIATLKFNTTLSIEECRARVNYMHVAGLDLKCSHVSCCNTTKVIAQHAISIPTPTSHL